MGVYIVAVVTASLATALVTAFGGAVGETLCGGAPICGIVGGLIAGYVVADKLADWLVALGDSISELCGYAFPIGVKLPYGIFK